jgi:hypothetical protein
MKKLLTAAVLAVGLIGLSARPAPAGAFGLFYCHSCCCCGGCNVCLRPYNAFTPVVCGNLCCDGCVPFCPTGAYAGAACGPVGAGPLMGPGCDGGGCYGQLPPVSYGPGDGPEGVIGMVPQGPAAPIVSGPLMGNVSPAGLQPTMYPGYVYGPMMPPQTPPAQPTTAPVYWNK